MKIKLPSGKRKDSLVSAFCGSQSKVKVLRKYVNSVGSLIRGVVNFLLGEIFSKNVLFL